MQATILPHIVINESLKICCNLPHKFCYNWPRGHDLIEKYNNLSKSVTSSSALP